MLRRSALAVTTLAVLLVPPAGASATSGGPPASGPEVLKLALLGLVLFLVAARLRVVLRQGTSLRRAREKRSRPEGHDPDEPPAAGLLPSTATAKLRARQRQPEHSS